MVVVPDTLEEMEGEEVAVVVGMEMEEEVWLLPRGPTVYRPSSRWAMSPSPPRCPATPALFTCPMNLSLPIWRNLHRTRSLPTPLVPPPRCPSTSSTVLTNHQPITTSHKTFTALLQEEAWQVRDGGDDVCGGGDGVWVCGDGDGMWGW